MPGKPFFFSQNCSSRQNKTQGHISCLVVIFQDFDEYPGNTETLHTAMETREP